MDEQKQLSITLEAQEITGTVRLDLWLSQKLSNLSRTKLQKLIALKKVKVNQNIINSKYLVKLGDLIELNCEVETWNHLNGLNNSLEPQVQNLNILYEDQSVIVINKPAGLTMHPGAGTHSLTLVQGLIAHCQNNLSQLSGQIRPGIVHRLDKDTSGVVVCAKNDFAHQHLALQFAKKTNLRIYRVLLDGWMQKKEIIVENFLCRDPKNRLKFTAKTSEELQKKYGNSFTDIPKNFRWSKSTFKRQKVYGHRFTEAWVNLSTGRTHQIRVHSACLGLPVLGDPLYNKVKTISQNFSVHLRKNLQSLKRQMLHAEVLGFIHPVTNQYLEFRAPLPKDFTNLLELLSPYQEQDAF